MAGMNHSKKRDFVQQMTQTLEKEKQQLAEKGFDATQRLGSLTTKNKELINAENDQQEALAKAKEATSMALEKLDTAYTEASETLDLLAGLLGKNNELVKRIRTYRK